MMALGAFLCVWVSQQITQVYPISPKIEVVVPKGAGLNRTARMLQDKGVIREALLFVLYVRLKGLAGQIKAGEYSSSYFYKKSCR